MLLFLSAGAFLLFYLLPENKTADTVKGVTAMLCIAAFAVPLYRGIKNGSTDIEGFAGVYEAETEELYAYFEQSAVRTAEAVIENTVRAYTEESYECEIITDITADGCIDIKRVLITFEKTPENINDIASALQNALGTAPEFEVKVHETTLRD